ncbi:MAG: glycosyltransferase family 39 protein [Candidatus Dormibacteraeota bacterium]|nr:glycosyltransferase family 39 protein [Candidatus Dormibacteraeota bacterium]MBV9524405.1 glycosyltransferase family 39 protein [Candidatus Dormibacteraeota bacterium]
MTQLVGVRPGAVAGTHVLERRYNWNAWRGLETQSAAKRLPVPVPAIAILLGFAWAFYSVTHGWATLYNDSESHLDIARHITDGLTPGLAQLGSIWLPLPQLLMAPLVTIDQLWHSGIAGSIVSGLAFVYASVRIFSLAEELTGKRVAAWCTFAVFVTNLNLLYLQTTALDETVMLACFIGAAYHMVRWTRTRGMGDIALAGIATMLGTITRYDAWAMFLAEIAVVVLWTKLHDRRGHSTQANTLLFVFIGGYGIAMWFLYNLLIFHDPLYFLHSTYSAQAQQQYQLRTGYLPTKGHLTTSVATLGWAIADIVGPTVLVAGAVGALLMLFRRRDALHRNLAVMAILGAPIALNVFTLFVGQTTIRTPQLPPHQMFNLRYGLEALPFLAVCAGSMAARFKGSLTVVPLIAAAAASLMMAQATPVALAEGMTGASGFGRQQAQEVASYLKAHYTGGHILADDGSSAIAPLIFMSGIDLREFVTAGFHPYYENAKADPAGNAAWVLESSRDQIEGEMQFFPSRYVQYKLVYHVLQNTDVINLWERIGPAPAPPTLGR